MLFKLKALVYIVLAILVFSKVSYAQLQDTAKLTPQTKKKIYSKPRRAALLSTVLPGLGQAYNKRYWKIPIVYGGLGAMAYFLINNQSEYTYYRTNLIAVNDNNPSTINETVYSSDQLLTLKTTFRRRRDLFGFGLGLVYVINIIDANIDAHLKTFDISDNLSLKISPKTDVYQAGGQVCFTGGVALRLQFK